MYFWFIGQTNFRVAGGPVAVMTGNHLHLRRVFGTGGRGAGGGPSSVGDGGTAADWWRSESGGPSGADIAFGSSIDDSDLAYLSELRLDTTSGLSL